ncbi:hypothetical protein CH296_00405 [Rhodococcus sp. 14-2496-1d]|uniref:hypothetical protein n=1 Tax=Rhodococcus sp. 14-2496-1d TaxID=2023146 RepID=UPI000B9BCCB2|nr:hypothetical protein [Rhodococcus sp. 14-2496-1d]OZF40753.1 hypothetical protein CH296_00405 [Rhodococcus sp. 14-2496-1d]
MSVEVKVFKPTLQPANNRGTRVRTYSDTPTRTVRARQFAPAGAPEPHEPGRNAIVSAPTLYFRAGVDLTEYDRVEVFGDRYEVDGKPDRWTNSRPGGRRHGVVIRLKGVAG